MIRCRVWRDAPLAEERVVLGGMAGPAPIKPGDVPRALPRAEVVPERRPLQQEQRPTSANGGGERSARLLREQEADSAHEQPHGEPQRRQSRSDALEAALQSTREELVEAKAAVAELQTTREQLKETTAALEALQTSLLAEQARAKEQGYAEGLRQAQAAAQRALEEQLTHWRQSAEEMLRASDARTQALRTEITDVVMASLVKILGEQAANPHMIRAAVEQTLKESSAGAPLRVLLAPAQFEQLMKSGAAQLGWFKERRLEIAPDARVTHGGCLLETSSGFIDGRLETQLARLHEIISTHYTGSAR